MHESNKTFYVIDNDGFKHEIFMEEYIPRHFHIYEDGVGIPFSGSYLSFEVALETYCYENCMQPIQPGGASDSSITSCSQGNTTSPEGNGTLLSSIKKDSSDVNNLQDKVSSDPAPVDYLKTLAILHDLFKNEVITREEFDTLKTKIISFFGERT